MSAFLFKTEPADFAFADLMRDKRVVWEGVANALALQHLRTVRKGDTVVIYHTGSEKSAVGLATVTKGPYPDPSQADERRVVVDLKPMRALRRPVALSVFKTDPVLKATELVRISRLSVMPLTGPQLQQLLALADA